MIALEGAGHVVAYVNPAFATFFDQPTEALMGRPFAEAVPEGVRNGCLAMLGRVLDTGVSESVLWNNTATPATVAADPTP